MGGGAFGALSFGQYHAGGTVPIENIVLPDDIPVIHVAAEGRVIDVNAHARVITLGDKE